MQDFALLIETLQNCAGFNKILSRGNYNPRLENGRLQMGHLQMGRLQTGHLQTGHFETPRLQTDIFQTVITVASGLCQILQDALKSQLYIKKGLPYYCLKFV